jgi:L-2-hydroxyglutarate oxidase
VRTSAGEVLARKLVNCGGLQSDRVAALDGATAPPSARIIPFRGEYRLLTHRAARASWRA